MGSFTLGVNIIFNTVHVFMRDRSVPPPVKGLKIGIIVEKIELLYYWLHAD